MGKLTYDLPIYQAFTYPRPIALTISSSHTSHSPHNLLLSHTHVPQPSQSPPLTYTRPLALTISSSHIHTSHSPHNLLLSHTHVPQRSQSPPLTPLPAGIAEGDLYSTMSVMYHISKLDPRSKLKPVKHTRPNSELHTCFHSIIYRFLL